MKYVCADIGVFRQGPYDSPLLYFKGFSMDSRFSFRETNGTDKKSLKYGSATNFFRDRIVLPNPIQFGIIDIHFKIFEIVQYWNSMGFFKIPYQSIENLDNFL